MTATQTSCPECDKPATPGEDCPYCGTPVGDAVEDGVVEPGRSMEFRSSPDDLGWEAVDGEVSLKVEIEEHWAELPSRTIYLAVGKSCQEVDGEEGALDERIEGTWFLVEEMKESWPEGIEEFPAAGAMPLRRPLGRRDLDGSPVLLFENDAGVSLSEIAAMANQKLSLEQVASIFEAVLEGVERLHQAGMLFLGLTPDRIRVRLDSSNLGVPVGDEEEDSPSQARESSRSREQSSPLESVEEISEAGEDEESSQGGEEEWDLAEYEQTRPKGPEDLESFEESLEEISSMGGLEEESDVEVEPEDFEKDSFSWLRKLGVDPEASDEQIDEEREVLAVDYRSDVPEVDGVRLAVDLEPIFDTTGGLFSRDELPDELMPASGYSAPEIYSGEGREIDTTTDVFSLGAVLYFLVAGRPPPASVYTRHAPAVPARNFRPSFPPGLGPVIKRATRPDPEMRYPDVGSMRTAFQNALDAIEDRPPEQREAVPSLELEVDRHIGIAKRERNPVNQDDVFRGVSDDGKFALVVVADGVSTASFGSGDVASEKLVEVGREVWDELLPSYLMEEPIDEAETIGEILEEANRRIVEYVNERHTPFEGEAHEVMGTTALVAIYHRGEVTLGSIGDSRAYLQRGPGLEQLTIDHNLWTLSVLEGLPADEALSMPSGDALARCLGTFVVEEGQLEAVEPNADIFRFPVAGDDTLLLTTDGLVDFAGGNVAAAEENILATLLAEPDPALACLELILLANRGGGGDNIGLGVGRFE